MQKIPSNLNLPKEKTMINSLNKGYHHNPAVKSSRNFFESLQKPKHELNLQHDANLTRSLNFESSVFSNLPLYSETNLEKNLNDLKKLKK